MKSISRSMCQGKPTNLNLVYIHCLEYCDACEFYMAFDGFLPLIVRFEAGHAEFWSISWAFDERKEQKLHFHDFFTLGDVSCLK